MKIREEFGVSYPKNNEIPVKVPDASRYDFLGSNIFKMKFWKLHKKSASRKHKCKTAPRNGDHIEKCEKKTTDI